MRGTCKPSHRNRPRSRLVPAMTHEALPSDLVEALLRPASYPPEADAGESIEHVQTHISEVFLTRSRVYKLRRAVDLGFVDFSRRAARDEDARREVVLNRRLAPDVYLGLAPVARDSGGWRVEPVGERIEARAVEHAVVMRRLPAGRDALSLLRAGRLSVRALDRLADRLARFHASVQIAPGAGAAWKPWRERIARPIAENFAMLAKMPEDVAPRATLALACSRALAFEERFGARLDAREAAGRLVDGHGDLHLDHVWFEADDAEPLVIDCLEFSEDLRLVDAACDVAFLSMDLAYRGREDLAERLLARYAQATDDWDLYGVIDYYASYRAAVRAKVAGIAAGDAAIAPGQRKAAVASARDHLALAARLLAPREGAQLWIVCGIVGTGKSTVARALAEELGAAVIASDRVRKQRLGASETARLAAAPDAGAYAPEERDRVYGALLERAAPVVDSGRIAILDATYDTRARRESVLGFARERGLPVRLVETRCAPAVACERLARRQAVGTDPSDAGPDFHPTHAARFEPPEEWPKDAREAIDTGDERWGEALGGVIERLRPARAAG